MRFVCFFIIMTISQVAFSQIEHQLLRKMVVFPIYVEQQNSNVAEDSWWKLREELARDQRFLVATKRFLVKNEVYQARKKLSPADVIILGKLLDANAIISTFLEKRKLSMVVYDGYNGLELWKKSVNLQPSQTIKSQLTPAVTRLIGDFIASVPYHGFLVLDPIMKRTFVREGDLKLAKVDIGKQSGVSTGDRVQWMQIFHSSTQPLFQGGARTEVFAEGRVIKIEDGIATVEMTTVLNQKLVVENSLVSIPKQMRRLRERFSLKDGIPSQLQLDRELLSPEAAQDQKEKEEERSISTVLSWVGSLVILLVLAF